ncbi:MAG: SusC/RagA family TonB-linked outer membrane protein, partial [Prevotellaceae bacterium]|nr:SusC/RagA family TonB-linked outer membrane protein [Prevotellaceae bacterium]
AKHLNGSGNNGVVTEYSTNYRKLVSSSTLNYNTIVAEKHNIGVLVGWEAEKNDTDYLQARGINMSTPLLTTIRTAGSYTADGYTSGHSMLSLLSRAEYSYDNKYYLSGSYRRDGSSRLGPNTRWGDFWSVGGAWRINNEQFMKGLTTVSNLRLVASYGINGTLPNGYYGWRSLNAYSRTYMNNPAGYVSTFADANLAWETNYTTNAALEIGLLQNRINASIGYYNRDSENLLQDVPVSRVTGFGSTLRNIGLINNNGIEIEINGDIIRNKDVRWNLGITASTLQSKVKKLYDHQQIIWWEPVDDDAQFIYREGESTLAFYGLEYAGVKEIERNGTVWGMSMWYLNDGTKPQDAPYIINGRAATDDWTDAEEVILGDANPKLFGGINTDISWKGFTLGLNFIYRLGGYTYDGFTYTNDDGYMFERPRSKYAYDNRWTPEHRNAKYPQWIAIDMEDVNQYSSRHMYKADYLRLKQVTLSYDIPKTIVSKAGMSGARVYFNGTNLLTFAKQDNFDPEVGALGIRSVQMPFGKTYTFGLELNF